MVYNQRFPAIKWIQIHQPQPLVFTLNNPSVLILLIRPPFHRGGIILPKASLCKEVFIGCTNSRPARVGNAALSVPPFRSTVDRKPLMNDQSKNQGLPFWSNNPRARAHRADGRRHSASVPPPFGTPGRRSLRSLFFSLPPCARCFPNRKNIRKAGCAPGWSYFCAALWPLVQFFYCVFLPLLFPFPKSAKFPTESHILDYVGRNIYIGPPRGRLQWPVRRSGAPL